MKKSNILFIIIAVCVSISAIAYSNYNKATLSKLGSVSNEVKQIQTKLANYGYDVGKIDGVYGEKTKKAIIKFQKNNNLTPDGVAGSATLAALGINPTPSSRENDIMLLARIINAESRGEPYVGQVAVGAVVLNRTKHPSFPDSISGVIYQPYAFTALNDGEWNSKMHESAYKAANDAMNGWDPTYGSIYYYNPAKTTNTWIYSRPVTTTIGNHVFAK